MTNSERQQILTRCLQPATWYVVKLRGVWFVKSRETGELFPHGPSFRRKRDAVRFAEDNTTATYKRLTEERRP